MIQQISVVYLVKASLCQQEAHMLLKLFTVLKCGRKAFHDGVLLRRKPVRVSRIHGGKMVVQHFLLTAFQQYGSLV